MNKITKKSPSVLSVLLFFGLVLSCFYSCQKAELKPYSDPAVGVTHTITPTYTATTHDTTKPPPPDTTPSFSASVNSSSIISFTPSKSISGSNITIKGVSTYYTITITFPSSTGPGNYDIGFPSTTVSASMINGATKNFCSYNGSNAWGNGGNLKIDSISSKGKYYGTFNFEAEDTVTYNFTSINQGSFYHL